MYWFDSIHLMQIGESLIFWQEKKHCFAVPAKTITVDGHKFVFDTFFITLYHYSNIFHARRFWGNAGARARSLKWLTLLVLGLNHISWIITRHKLLNLKCNNRIYHYQKVISYTNHRRVTEISRGSPRWLPISPWGPLYVAVAKWVMNVRLRWWQFPAKFWWRTLVIWITILLMGPFSDENL